METVRDYPHVAEMTLVPWAYTKCLGDGDKAADMRIDAGLRDA